MMLTSDHEEWMTAILNDHREEALNRVSSLLANTTTDSNGCRITDTKTRQKVRFLGGQTASYRFIYSVVNEEVLAFDEVVRHRCHNPLCINPDHLEIGSRRENKHDDWMFAAYGVDPMCL